LPKYGPTGLVEPRRREIPVCNQVVVGRVAQAAGLARRQTPVATADPNAVAADAKTQVEYFDSDRGSATKDPTNPKVHYTYAAEGWQLTRAPIVL
jgi:hypothetical protein